MVWMTGNTWIAIGIVATVVAAFSIPYGFHLKSQESSKSDMAYIRTLVDSSNRALQGSEDVVVLREDIVDANRGYMHIRVSKDYLNTRFKSPITLKYSRKKYQPVMLTFKDHEQWGAGVIFVSPEKDKKAEIYLNQCFRFQGFGQMYYTKDLVFEFYYSSDCVYLVTNSAEVRFERQLPPIRFGKNLCIGYFDPSNEAINKQASADFPRLEEFFQKRIEEQRPNKAL